MIADINPLLQGWGNYFRTRNATDKFRQADWYYAATTSPAAVET